ncbi:MAG: DUF92 domain-containing protein [Chitinophagaceae bacterium]|nr:DUF92 domain-containing protein [Chitinophagaceae bacterium]
MILSYYIIFFIIVLGITLSVQKHKLTFGAAITGGVGAWILFVATGITGIILLTVFFLMGVAATAHRWNAKQAQGFTDNSKGERTAGQVIANSGVAVIISLLILFKQVELNKGILMIAGSFAAAAADTVSSEMGNIYGRKFYDILSFKQTSRGANGAISREGTLAGIAAALVIAVAYLSTTQWIPVHIIIITIAGTIGNITDSVLGTTLENRKLLSNNAVNFINTGAGAVSALLLYAILYH